MNLRNDQVVKIREHRCLANRISATDWIGAEFVSTMNPVIAFLFGIAGVPLGLITDSFWAFLASLVVGIVVQATVTSAPGPGPNGSASARQLHASGSFRPAQLAWNRAASYENDAGKKWGHERPIPRPWETTRIGGRKVNLRRAYREWGLTPTNRKTYFVPHFVVVDASYQDNGDLKLTCAPTHDGLSARELQSFVDPYALFELHMTRMVGQVTRHPLYGTFLTAHLTMRELPVERVELNGANDEWVIGSND